ncbi:MAG: methylmalonyl-CoA mutase family protein [Thermodesulfobacteriota bacterium]
MPARRRSRSSRSPSLPASSTWAASRPEGLSPDTIAGQMKFSFSVGSSYFMEIAKLRAARLLWAEIAERFEPAREESKQMKLETRTSSWNKTVFDPYVNMLRGTVEAMAASIGGGRCGKRPPARLGVQAAGASSPGWRGTRSSS